MEAELPTTSSRQMAMIFFVQLIVNSLVVWIANMIFPNLIVLGNANSNLWWSIFHSMIMLSLVGTLFIPAFEFWQAKRQSTLTTKDWMIGYLVINFVTIWIISRFSEQFGLGIAAWWIGLILAVVLDTVQGLATKFVMKQTKENYEEMEMDDGDSEEEITIVEMVED